MTILTSSEIVCLENYRFMGYELGRSGKNRNENEYLLCLKTVDGITQIDTVKRTDVTTWELFKSYFGQGKLAGYDLRMSAIASYLQKKSINELLPDSRAYQTIHAIASRVLVYRKNGAKISDLWQHLATESKSFDLNRMHRSHYWTNSPGYPHLSWNDSTLSKRKVELFITPLTTFKHLSAQVDILERRSLEEIKEHPTQCGRDQYRYLKNANLNGVSFNYVKQEYYPSCDSRGRSYHSCFYGDIGYRGFGRTRAF